ncbi:MAG: TonB-dependent receptor [Candidatus Omnitrophica bacterium]|nr:TonB-dependent receptor [Candidatus Omnitrophota bacterium]
MLKKNFYILFGLFVLIFLNGSSLLALDYDLGNVIVSATKTPAYQNEVGACTTVISGEELSVSANKSVYEILKQVPGLSVDSLGSFGGAVSINIRGAKRGQTLVMIDGVEVYDPMAVSKDFDFAHLTSANIERIEIVRGPQSTLYGSDAMAGVINIITKQGKGPAQTQAIIEIGSHNTFMESISLSGSEDKIDFSAAVSRTDSDGISKARDGQDNDGYSNNTFSTRMGLAVSDNSKLSANMRYINAQVDVDDGAYEDDPNRVTQSEQFSGSFDLAQQINENWDHVLTFSGVSFDRNDSDPADSIDPTENEYSRFRGDRKKIEWQHNLSLAQWDTETIGYEYEQERGASYATGTNWWSNNQSDRRSLENRAFYFQNQAELADDLFTSAGFRVDSHDIFGSEWTYKLSSSYLIPDSKTRLKINYGTGFRAPNIYQLYDGSYGNSKLQPEKSRGFDLGVEHRCIEDKLFVSATFFYDKYKNLIDSDPITWAYVNIKNGTSRGYELESSFDIIEALKIGANYTYTKTRDSDTAKEFGRRAKNQANSFIQWDCSEKTDIRLSTQYVGSRMDAPAYNDNKNKKYFITNIASEYELNQDIQLFGRIENIFDIAYEPIRGYNGMDRVVYLGVKGAF